MNQKTLSDNELAVMCVLWESSGPLSRPEILEELTDMDWNPNSIHMVLNNLIKKKFVAVDGIVPCGQSYGRAYTAVKSQEEYAAELALSAVPGVPPEECLPGIVGAMMKSVPVNERTIELLKQLLEQQRRELRGAEA